MTAANNISGSLNFKMSIVQRDIVSLPVYSENKSKGYITWGDNNFYPEFLLQLFDGSAIHSAILQTKQDYIYSGGLKSNKPGIATFISQMNKNGDTFNDIFRKIIGDFETFGSFALQIIYTKGSNVDSPKIAGLFYVDVKNVRYNLTRDKLLYKNDWSNFKEVAPKIYDVFDLSNPVGEQIFFFNGGARDIYGRESYRAAKSSIKADVEIADYHQNITRNGFATPIMLNFLSGIPSEEEQAEVNKRIHDKFTGVRADSIMTTWSEPGATPPQVVTINNNDDNRFIPLANSTIEKIIEGHRMQPILAGLQVNGNKLSNSSEFELAFSIFQETYVTPRRTQIITALKKLLSVNFGKNVDLDVIPMRPITIPFSDARTLTQVMYPSELRKKLQDWSLIDDANNKPEGESMIGDRNSPNLNKESLAATEKDNAQADQINEQINNPDNADTTNIV